MTLTMQGIACPEEGYQSDTFHQPSAGDGWEVSQDALGWLGMWRPADECPPDGALAEHADWIGPTKLVCARGRVIQRVDFFLGRRRWSAPDASLDFGAASLRVDLADELRQLAHDVLGGPRPPADWRPPPARSMAEWLEAAGHVVAMDRDGNLRLTLTRPGCDGQICATVQPGRCRFTMPLGQWQDLPDAAEAAMLCLIHQANARLRLVRLAWTIQGSRRRGEAQVDLSGLPWADPCPEPMLDLWRAMVEEAMAGLERALLWLGHELPLLALPEHGALAESLLVALCEA